MVTRELKIALIVGFSLVLVVAVLISDHLSSARTARLASAEAASPTPTGLTPVDPIRTAENTAFGTEAALALGEGKPAVVSELARERAARDEADRRAAREAGPITIAMGTLADRLADGQTPPPAMELTGGPALGGRLAPPDPDRAIIDEITAAGGEVVAVGDVRDVKLPPSSPTIDEEPATPAAPTPRTHTVAQGQSLFQIAKQYYGDGGRWKAIADANPGRVGERGAVRVGVTLVIPDAEQAAPRSKPAPTAEPQVRPTRANEQRLASNTPAEKPAAKAPASKPASKPAAKPAPKTPEPKVASKSSSRSRTYTVRAGDTAGKIAQRLLGTSKRADELLEFNDIEEAESLRVGMVLKLPVS